jgi:DNA gyrase subunit A
MSVIVGRALPDVRDGLKPVHRRVLFAMHELGNDYNKPYKKSARVVGDVIGKYHPHGDGGVRHHRAHGAAVLAALPAGRRPGQLRFGRWRRAAAMRYTEVRMSKLTHELLADIDKETVDFQPNYDEKEQSPRFCRPVFPTCWSTVRPASRWAWRPTSRRTTSVRVIDALLALIDEPGSDIDELMQHIPGPDFPTAGIINGVGGIHRGLSHRSRPHRMRARRDRDRQRPRGRDRHHRAALPGEQGASDREDRRAGQGEEARGHQRVARRVRQGRHAHLIEVRAARSPRWCSTTSTADPDAVGVRHQHGGAGRWPAALLNLKDMLEAFVRHRREVVTRRTMFELRKARARAHVLEGLTVALANIDEMIELIKTSANPNEARSACWRGAGSRAWSRAARCGGQRCSRPEDLAIRALA